MVHQTLLPDRGSSQGHLTQISRIGTEDHPTQIPGCRDGRFACLLGNVFASTAGDFKKSSFFFAKLHWPERKWTSRKPDNRTGWYSCHSQNCLLEVESKNCVAGRNRGFSDLCCSSTGEGEAVGIRQLPDELQLQESASPAFEVLMDGVFLDSQYLGQVGGALGRFPVFKTLRRERPVQRDFLQQVVLEVGRKFMPHPAVPS